MYAFCCKKCCVLFFFVKFSERRYIVSQILHFFFWLNVFGQEWSASVPYKFIFGAYLTFSGPTSLHIIIEGTFIQDKSRLM